MLKDFIKNSDIYKNFLSEAKTKTLNHSYIIYCEDEEVKNQLIEELSFAVYCENSSDNNAKTKAIREGSFPDIKIYGGKLAVKDIEKFVEDCYTKGFYGGTKLYFFRNAEILSPIVQNKLLKTMEEPPNNVTTIFLSANEESLLATIKSRAKKLYAPRLNGKKIEKILIDDGVSIPIAKVAAEYSNDNLDKAKNFSTNNDYINYYSFAISLLKDCKKSGDIVNYINSPLLGKENISLILDFMQIILKAIMEKIGEVRENLNFDIAEIAKSYNIKSIVTAILCIEESRKKVAVNVNNVAVLETLLFEILEAKYKWR